MSQEEQRYGLWYEIGNLRFYLEEYTPDIQESKFLLTKVIEQAVNDYCTLERVNIPRHMEMWESSKEFIFNDNYSIEWGDMILNLEDICDILDLDIDWVRYKTKEKYRKKNESKRE